MENSAEPSSSISFTSPSHLSNGSINNKVYASGGSDNLEVISLKKLSYSLEQLLCEPGSDFSDADIVVEGKSIGIHRCILAARSKFFDDLFRNHKGSAGKEGKPKYSIEDLSPKGRIGYEALVIVLSYLYTGRLKPSPPEVSTCVDSTCIHDGCRPAIDFAVELMYASAVFQVAELMSLFQRRLLNLAGKAIVEDIIPILIVAFDCRLSHLRCQCINRVAQSDLENIAIEKEIPPEVADIKLIRLNSQAEDERHAAAQVDHLREKQVKRMHKALDSDDVELVRLLLTDSEVTLDEAFALHYAITYCDPKIVKEVLSLGLADVNLRNTRGHTVLHIAARRKEPSIIVSLLTKGASASDLTPEGQNALSICRRLTKPKDYEMKRQEGCEANNDRICIDVLEREMSRNPFAEDTMLSLAVADDLYVRSLYLEDRVSFARMFFPTEAKLAMEIAHAETTSGLAGLLSSRGSSGNLEVDLNESPHSQKKRLLARIETLSRTVELGHRYFPNCSQVLDKFMEDDLPDAIYLEKGTDEEQRMKRLRFMELKDEVQKAFTKDKAELHLSGFSSSPPRSFKDRMNMNSRARKI
ncbi:BTB/POZ domain and ankyrin repeat-containing protein NPR1 [Andrographis paniculata]|uniref:BTB/POZ domain and ankyrin repeat-containing protein NPR1 n=1 Tax=Andrographis paniculata TaxID=175694 RepID=UPI0021E87E4D|nr:BTB/POZ domain and ankyrin repeat-containing protein NPR1 [Andrographis paniculata]XP_051128969.1 BTB/POZ domain and ankyrin repeat-containing protein NPR1 [Andrographis paniculata]